MGDQRNNMKFNLKVENMKKKSYSCFSCTDCGEKGMTVKNLNKHAEQKHGGMKCNQCEKSFKTIAGVRQHVQGAHADAKHSCNFCGKTFSMKSALKTHINMHLGLKPYKCDKCDSNFRGLDSFSKHKRLHKSEVTCQVCGKGLYKQEYLKSHMRKHMTTKASNFTLAEKADAVALARYSNCQI